MQRGRIIVVDGPIGAGKTTLVKDLEKLLRARNHDVCVMSEEVDPVLLESFYGSRDGQTGGDNHSLFFQSQNLHNRWRCAVKAKAAADTGQWVLLDTCPRRDTVFACVNLGRPDERLAGGYALDTEHWRAYATMHGLFAADIAFVPDVRLTLDAAPEFSKRNIDRRRREDATRACEASITLDYLRRLRRAHEHYADVIVADATHELRLAWDDFQPAADVLARIDAALSAADES